MDAGRRRALVPGMIITAKYESTCPTCRQPIRTGSEVEWTRGSQAQHVACANGAPASAAAPARGTTGRRRAPRKPAAPRQPRREPQSGEQTVGRRSKAYTIGETIHGAKLRGGGGPDGCYWTVTHEWFQRANEDLGYYADEYMAHVRPATDEEVAPVLARLAAGGARAACEAWLTAALSTGAPGVTTVSDTGTLPPAAERQAEIVLGRRVGASGAVTDGGTTYVVTADSIVAHHGGYYDDYRSSTRTLALSSTTVEEIAAKREIAMLVTALAASDDQTIAVLADRARELGHGKADL